MLSLPLPPGAAVPYLLLVFATLCWAGNFVLARALHADISPITLAFGRWLTALLVLLPLAWPRLMAQKALLLQVKKRLLWLALYGIAISNTLIYIGLRSTKATNAVLFNALVPLMVMLLAWVAWRRPLSSREWGGTAASLVGVLAIVCQGDLTRLLALNFNPGDIWVCVGLGCWAVYTLLLRGLPEGLDRLAVLTVTVALGLAILLPFCLFDISRHGLPAASVANFASVAYLGIFPSVLALLSYMRAVQHLGPTQAAGFLHLIPAFGALLAMLFLDEQLAYYHVAGLAAIFAGLYWAQSAAPAPAPAAIRPR
ncbi:DMT family transporter [Chitinimonas lacunae]|uniref:DMT family transporter n=1 Tax=Chitinimonas lacunae TaxID=1963018 RepID=A0ABV8MNI6_9NEIS